MNRSTPIVLSQRAENIANEFAIISTTLLITATLLFLARIWTRCFPLYRMFADDYVSAIAYMLVVINTSLFFKSIEWTFPTWGGDRSKLTIGDLETSILHAIIAQPFWAWGMAAIKISIGLMLLRFESKKFCRRFLWAMITFQVVLGMYSMLANLFSCLPLRKAWDLTNSETGVCWPRHTSVVSQIAIQVFVILTDWIFALLPISFLRKVQRPLRERVIIGFLMGLGVFTGVASIIKIKQILGLRRSTDIYSDYIIISMWCSIEAMIGFIASCVPCLRAPFQRILEHLGVITVRETTMSTFVYPHYPGTQYTTKITGKNVATPVGIPIGAKRTSTSDGESVEQIISPHETSIKNRGIWCTTEVAMREEERLKTPRGTYAQTTGMD